MGRKRKTRWRRLSIGEISGNEEEDGDLAGAVASLTRSLSSSQNHSPARGHSDKALHNNSSTIMTKGSNSSTSLHNSSNSLSNGPNIVLTNGEMSSPKKHGNSTTTLVNGDSSSRNGDSGSVSSGQSSSGTAHGPHNSSEGGGGEGSATNGYNGQGNYHHHHNNHHYDSPSSHYDRYHYHKDNYRPPSYYNNGSYDRSDRGGYHGGGHHHKEYHGGYQGYHSNYNYRNNYNNYRNTHYTNAPATNGSSTNTNGATVTNGGSSGSEGYNGGGSDYQYPHPSRSYGAGRFRRSRSYPASNYYYANGSSHSGGAANNCDNTNKPSYNQDEYTKITTPRQDVLFKKGYLSQKKSSVDSTSTATTPSASNNGTPDTQSTNGINSDYSEGYENGETDCVIPYDDAYYYGPPPPEAVFTDPNTGQVYYGHCSSSGEYYDAYPVSPMMVAGYPPTVYYPVPYPIDWNGVPAPMYPSVVALPPHPNGHQPNHLEDSLDPSHSLQQLQGVELTPIDNQMAKSDTSAPTSEGESPPSLSSSPGKSSPTNSSSCSETNSSVVEKAKDSKSSDSPPLPELVTTSSPSSSKSSSDVEKSTVPNKRDNDNNNSSSKSQKKDKPGVSLSTGGKQQHSKKADLSSSSASSTSPMSSGSSSTTSSAPVSPPGGTGSSIPSNPNPSSSISNQSSATTITTTSPAINPTSTTVAGTKGHNNNISGQSPHNIATSNPGSSTGAVGINTVISTVQLPHPLHHNNNINNHQNHYTHQHNQAVRHHVPPPQMNHHGPPPPLQSLQSYPGIPPSSLQHHQLPPPPHPMALGGPPGPPPQYHHMYPPLPHQPHPGPGFVYGPPVYNGVVVPIEPVAAASAAASSSLSTIEIDTVSSSSPPSSSRKKRKKKRREKGGHEHGDNDEDNNGQLTDEVSADSADEPTPSSSPIPTTLDLEKSEVEIQDNERKIIETEDKKSLDKSEANPIQSQNTINPKIIMDNLTNTFTNDNISSDNLQKPKEPKLKETDIDRKTTFILNSSSSSSQASESQKQSTETSSAESSPTKKSKKASRKNILAKESTPENSVPLKDLKKSHKLSQESALPKPKSTMEMTVDGDGEEIKKTETENKNSNEAGSNPDGDSSSSSANPSSQGTCDASVDLSTPAELIVEKPLSSGSGIQIGIQNQEPTTITTANMINSSCSSSSKKPQDLKVECPLDFNNESSDLSHLHLLQSPDFITTTEPSSPDSLNTTQSIAGSEIAGVENLSVSESELLMMNRTTSIDEVEEDLPQEHPSESSISVTTPTEIFPYESTSTTPSMSLCQPVSEVSEILEQSLKATKEDITPVPCETKDENSSLHYESPSTLQEESMSSPLLQKLDVEDVLLQTERETIVQEPLEKTSLSELEQQPLTDVGHAESVRESESECLGHVDVNTSSSSDLNKEEKERPRSITLAVSEWLKTQGDDALTPIAPTAALSTSIDSSEEDIEGDAEDSDYEYEDEQKPLEHNQKNGYGNPWVAPSNKSGSMSSAPNGSSSIRGNLTKSNCRSGSMKEDCRNINQKDGVVGSRVACQQSTVTNNMKKNDSINQNQNCSKSTWNKSGPTNYDSGLELSSPENNPEKDIKDQKTMKEKKMRKSEERDLLFQSDKKCSERSSSLISYSSNSTNNNASLDEKDHTEICDPQKFAKYYQFGVVFDTDHDQGIDTEEDSLEEITLTRCEVEDNNYVKDNDVHPKDFLHVMLKRNKIKKGQSDPEQSPGTSVVLKGYCDENEDEEIGTFDPKSLPKRFSTNSNDTKPDADPREVEMGIDLKNKLFSSPSSSASSSNHLYINPMSLARELVESSSSSGEPLSDSWDVDSEPLPDYESPPAVEIPVYNDLTPQGKVIRKNLQAVGMGDSVTSAICCCIQ